MTVPEHEVWARLAENVPPSIVQWRQQGRPKARDGKWFAPFVAYIDAQFVRDRLDGVVPGEWNLSLQLLPMLNATPDGEVADEPCAFQATLKVLGAERDDVGTGRDYKTAATDAFKRAAVRYGIGHELYTEYEITWVQVDSDSKYAKPLEDPAAVFARRNGRTAGASAVRGEHASVNGDSERVAASEAARGSDSPRPEPTAAPSGPLVSDEPNCPKCGGRMFDNRLSKRNPKAPDFKCKNRSCDGVIWPPRKGTSQSSPEPGNNVPEWLNDESEIPF